jgi:hypothetical protein
MVNRAPVDSGIGEHDSEAALGAESAIHVADGRNQPLVHRRVPGENVDGVPPFLGQRMLPYRCNGDVTVDTILVARIARRYREVRKDDISGRVALATTAFPSSGSVSRRLWKRPDAT